MTLLLASSLSRAVGGRIGLSESEVIEFLAAPNRKADEFLDAIQSYVNKPGTCIVKISVSL